MSRYQTDQFQRTRRVQMQPSRMSKNGRLAGIALALGLGAWLLPAAPLLVLGLAAVAWFSAKHAAGQRKLASAALALGALGLGVQGYVGFGVVQELRRGPAPAAAQSSATLSDQASPPAPDTPATQEPTLPEADATAWTQDQPAADTPAP